MNSLVNIRLAEWETRTPQTDPTLRDTRLVANAETRLVVERLARADILNIVELRDGLSIQAFAHVGKIEIGNVTVTIRPKIPAPSLLHLLRYAYDLRNLDLFADTTFDSEPEAFQDLLLHQLAEEAAELMARGLQRQYQRTEESLASPRGSLDMRKLARSGGMASATLPCVHYPRSQNTLPNQVLLSGLQWGANMALSPRLKTRLNRLAGVLREDVKPVRLNRETFARLLAESTRPTRAYQPAFTLIELLLAGAGIHLESDEHALPLSGFLFDMNRFFEALLSKFLRENLPGYMVRDQSRISNVVTYNKAYNPLKRPSPSLRPDYIVLDGNKTVAILDAKYRDLWASSLPPYMLYQLAMYALLGGCAQGAAILYPAANPEAAEQRVDICAPLAGTRQSQVVLRPVPLNLLEQATLQTTGAQAQRDRTALARQFAFGEQER